MMTVFLLCIFSLQLSFCWYVIQCIHNYISLVSDEIRDKMHSYNCGIESISLEVFLPCRIWISLMDVPLNLFWREDIPILLYCSFLCDN